MSGLIFLLNGRVLASVSDSGRNIICAYIAGDVIGPELAAAHMIGGNYINSHESDHRIWIDDVNLSERDEVEIQFSNTASTLGSGMTIEEHAKAHENDVVDEAEDVKDEDMHSWLAVQPRVREQFLLELVDPYGEITKVRTVPNDFSFYFGVMWKRKSPDRALVHLKSTSFTNRQNSTDGIILSEFSLQLGQSVKFRVDT